MRRAIGAVTIGQSPRGDLIHGLRSFLGDELPIIEAGALDGLSREEIEAGTEVGSGAVLLTRLRDGSSIRVREDFVTPRLQEVVDQLQDETDLILLMCTGSFAPLESRRPVLYPDRVVQGLVAGVGVQRLGVVTPLPEQIAAQEERWREVAPEVIVQAASPYASPEELQEAANRMAAAAPDAVVLDCVGYSSAARSIFRERTRKPVLLAISALARAAAELIA